jgi:hypothetical protein
VAYVGGFVVALLNLTVGHLLFQINGLEPTSRPDVSDFKLLAAAEPPDHCKEEYLFSFANS